MSLKRQTIACFFFAALSVASLALATPKTSPLATVLTAIATQELAPSDILDEARTKVGEGDYEGAVERLRQYLVLEPNDRQAKAELARVLSWDGLYAEALAVYDELLEQTRFDSDLGVERAQVLGWMGKYADAEVAVRAVLALEPEHMDGNLLLASVLEWQGREEESQQVYQWILKLDPSRQQASGAPEEPETPESSREWLLRFANEYSGDINGFMRFGSRIGLTMPLIARVGITPFAMAKVMNEEESDAAWGLGGGLGIDIKLLERLSLGVEGSALTYFDLPDELDWRGSVRLSSTPVDWLYLSLQLRTELYGEAGQSLAALAGGVRAWGGDLSAYMSRGRFEMFAMLTLLSLDRPGFDNSLITTGMASPKVRLFGEDHQFYLGYKLWFTGHSEAAPLALDYWSPARYFTHHLMLHLKGPIGVGSYFVEAGAGVGHEFEPASGVGTPSFVEEQWSFFPVAVGGAGLRIPLAPRVELETGGWTTLSRRIQEGADSQYILWFVEANLNIRW